MPREIDTVTRRQDATLHAGGPAAVRGTWRRCVLQRFEQVLRQIIGAPDYDAYLEHCRQAGHLPRLSEQEYVEEFFEAKGKGLRCC